MALSNPLRHFRELNDGLLEFVALVVFRGVGYALGALRHSGIAQARSVLGERAHDLDDLGVFRREFCVLDRIDALTKADDEIIDVLSEINDVFLGRPNRRLSFEHAAGVIGQHLAKLERS